MKRILFAILFAPLFAFSQAQPWNLTPANKRTTLKGITTKPTHNLIVVRDSNSVSDKGKGWFYFDNIYLPSISPSRNDGNVTGLIPWLSGGELKFSPKDSLNISAGGNFIPITGSPDITGNLFANNLPSFKIGESDNNRIAFIKDAGYNGQSSVANSPDNTNHIVESRTVTNSGSNYSISAYSDTDTSNVNSRVFQMGNGLKYSFSKAQITGSDYFSPTSNNDYVQKQYVDSSIAASGGGGGSGTVTSVSVTSANGFSGSVATSTTTPAITIGTTVTGITKGNGTALSAAVAGTDYVAPSDATYVKSVVLNTPNVLYTDPINFITASNTATGALTLNNQTPNFGFLAPLYPLNGVGAPTFRGIGDQDLSTVNTTNIDALINDNFTRSSGLGSAYTIVGSSASYSIATNKLQISGGIGTYTDRLEVSQYDDYEDSEMIYDFTSTVAGTGIYLGKIGTNGVFAHFNLSAVTNRGQVRIITRLSGTDVVRATSTANLTYTDVTDVIRCKVVKSKFTFTAYFYNLTTPTNDPVTVSYSTDTDPSSVLFNNFSRAGLGTVGGTTLGSSLIYRGLIKRRPLIAGLGDSIMQGYYVTDWQNRYGTLINNDLAGEYVSLATNGNRSGNCLTAIAQLALIRPTYALICLAANDAANAMSTGTPTSAGTHIYNIEQILKACESYGTIPILMKGSPLSNGTWNTQLVSYNTAYDTYYAGRYTIIDGYTAINAAFSSYNTDGIHLNALGNQVLYGVIKAALPQLPFGTFMNYRGNSATSTGGSASFSNSPNGIFEVAVQNTMSGTAAKSQLRAINNDGTRTLNAGVWNTGFTTNGLYVAGDAFVESGSPNMNFINYNATTGRFNFSLSASAPTVANVKASVHANGFSTPFNNLTNGVNILPISAVAGAVSSGGFYNGTSWIAQGASATTYAINAGDHLFYSNTGTTGGVAYTPQIIAGITSAKNFILQTSTGALTNPTGLTNGIVLRPGTKNTAALTGVTMVSELQNAVANTDALILSVGQSTLFTQHSVGPNIGVATLIPTARLHLPAGTATAGTAPLKLTSGTNLTTPEAGAIEFDGSNYFGTVSTTRYTFPKTLPASASLNYGAIAGGAVQDQTISVTGAAVGDPVVLGTPNLGVTDMFFAWVSTTNTVTVRRANADPVNGMGTFSGTFKVNVIKQ